ncbi:MAG: hypothetical protein PHW74_10330 [Desulfobacca sp.]|nr:hypothetical protein [Desulfobacca sp.]
MDKHFLEFWGNFLINAAQSQRKLEDVTKWVRRGFVNVGELGDLFRQTYGLDRLDKDSPDFLPAWQKAEEDFRESFQDYLAVLGVVPRDEYVALAKKYEELKEKVAAQQETIRHLRMLLAKNGIDYGDLTGGFQELIRKQTDQFQKMMQDLEQLFQKDCDLH